MPTRAPNIQALVLVVNGTFNTLVALWIFADAKARRAEKPLFAALAMLLLGPLWLAFYMTDRPPRPDELAKKLGVSIEELENMVGEATAVSLVSLNKKWYETDSYKDVREIDILEDKKAEDPTHRLQNRDLMRLVTRGLNRNERLIIILYYYEDMTMKEIGATLDLSESRVSQMHSSIVARLQSQLAKRRPEFSS